MTEQQTYIHPDMENEDEIDLIALAKTFWAGRKTFFICLAIGTVLGLSVAILSPKEYTVSTIMVPQTGNKTGSSSLGGLAALAGISLDMNASSGEISPIIYPKIIGSVPFKLELMNTPIKFENIEKPVSLFDYYTNPIYRKTSVLQTVKKYTLGLPGVIIGAIKGKPQPLKISGTKENQPILLTEDQYKISEMIDKLIVLDVDAKQGFLTLTVTMPEALAAAQLAQFAQQLLQREITNFKIQKAKADLEFIQERYDELKAQAEGYQYNIAVKADKYKNLTSAVPQVETSRIQTKYGIASGVFQELAKQLEQAKIQVKKDTPIFTIIQPVAVPLEKSKPNRPMLLIIWVFLGGIIGTGIVFGKGFLANVKKKWKEVEN